MSIQEVIDMVMQRHQAFLENGTLVLSSVQVEPFSADLLDKQAYSLDWGSRSPEPGWPDVPGPRHDPESVLRYGVVVGRALRWAEHGSVRDLLAGEAVEYVVFEKLDKVDTHDYDVESGLDATKIPPDSLTLVIYAREHAA